jgi:hypothetical protein
MSSTIISNYLFVGNCVSVLPNDFARISTINIFLCFMRSVMEILVFNSEPELFMVGCGVHVGNTYESHIPSEFSTFNYL